MKIFLIIFFFFVLIGTNNSQSDTILPYGVTPQQEEMYKKWIDNLYEIGVRFQGDSVIITEESRKAAIDTQFRKLIYPKQYNWVDAQYLLKQMHLKIGFWYLINLYAADPVNKEQVLKFLLPFDGIFEMDRVMTSVFYTYALLDPCVATITNGKPDIKHPEIVEQKLAVVKEIVDQIMAQRAVKSDQK